ncbi:MAG TPA: hypothetical protein VJ064_08635 [Limnochordia bacterium]|jgi:DUF438 domain-containing protein|nr:hypothetical protein [Bacillota bacterium]HKM18273.1 hypothetical protein [Limnochordia bacterium]
MIAETRIADRGLTRQIAELVKPCLNSIKEMIYKEENILFPMCLELLTDQEWQEIANQSGEIGYAIISYEDLAKGDTEEDGEADLKEAESEAESRPQRPWHGQVPAGLLEIGQGFLSADEITRIFNTLPFDITFVDQNDQVRYFSQGRDGFLTTHRQ